MVQYAKGAIGRVNSQKPPKTEGPGMDDLLIKLYRGNFGVTDQAGVYVTTCSESAPVSPRLPWIESSPARLNSPAEVRTS